MKRLIGPVAAVCVTLVAAGCSRPAQDPAARAAPETAKPAPAAPAPAVAAPASGGTIEDPAAIYRVPLEDSPARGPADALVTIVYSTDFECPFCRRVVPTLRQVEDAYPGKVRLVVKHMPLSIHRNAAPAAMLAVEAKLTGGDAKFWELHDALFALPSLDRPALEKAAADAGLPRTVFEKYANLDPIRRDQNVLFSLGAGSTPTFFVNGRKVVGAVPFEQLKRVIDEELARAEALVASGVPREQLYARIIERGATAPVRLATPKTAPARQPAAAARVTIREDDPARGPADAKVTVALFSDFQCPFCSRVEPALRQLEQAFPRDVRVVWKHLPLDMHPNALPAARAAEAARLQGKFWPVHDALFSSQAALSDAVYAKAAREAGLDVPRFERDRAGDAAARRIAEDQALAARVGATGTPAMFFNCRKISGAKPFAELKAVVDQELVKADAALARGVPRGSLRDRLCDDNAAAAPPPAIAAGRTGLSVTTRPDDPVRGEANARVTIVEFSDFQCPFCARAVPVVDELLRSLGNDVRLVWKHLPLAMHPQALPAAIAAEAAREQGKFWPMHDRLFAQQQALGPETFERTAKELGLDLARFRVSVAAPATRARVEADAQAATALGVSGTPTFVVNGEAVLGAGNLRAVVERHLQTAIVANP